MKITVEELQKIVSEETEKILKENELDEGVFDLIKGAGKSLGKAASDVKNSGMASSLQADIQKAVQQSGMMAQKFIKTFEDLLARAQAMHLNDAEEEVKAELQALNTYMETAAKISNNDAVAPTGVEAPKDKEATSSPSLKDVPDEVEMAPAKTTPAAVDLPPKASPKPVEMSPDKPFDWRAGDAKGAKKKKPAISKDLIKRTYEKNNSDPRKTAKELGLTLDQIYKIMTSQAPSEPVVSKPKTTKPRKSVAAV